MKRRRREIKSGGETPRLPFDPDRVRSPEPSIAKPAGEAVSASAQGQTGVTESPLTVSQFNRIIKAALQSRFPAEIRVIGELSNISRPSGGHIYFTLKDSTSEVRCVMWRSSAQTLRFDLSEGLEVVAHASVDVYEPRGQYQLYVRKLAPCGVGALELAFQQLKEKLGRAGFFDVDRKRPLPAYPRTIAVVTSLTGAAIRDILQTIARRYPKIRIFVFGVRVQGEGSSEDIAGAIRRINCARASLGGIDAIIAGRGGGSIEDLWAFNSEAVARAIYDSQIPVVSAVGHEVDFTIADFVADVRAATPTAAAELVVPVLADVLHNFAVFEHRLRHAMRRRMETTRLRLSSVERVSWFRDPSTQVRRLHQGIDEIVGRLKLAKARRLNKLRSRLHQLETRMMQSRPSVQLAKRQSRLERISRHLFRGAEAVLRRKGVRARGMEIRMASLSPRRQFELGVLQLSQLGGRLDRAMSRYFQDQTGILASLDARLRASGYEQVLRRGFTITRRVRDGQVIRSAVETRPDDFVLTQTADGQFRSRVVDELPSEIFDA